MPASADGGASCRRGTARSVRSIASYILNVAKSSDAFQVSTIERLGKPKTAALAARPAHQCAAALLAARQHKIEFISRLEHGIANIAGAVLRNVDKIDRLRTMAQDEDGLGGDG